ncbi:MAG: hypothetical protein MGG37_13665 [Trichodesmium sp. MAG_R01]|nr:hypothetical protein [Trichodesmium sp. MAG_R01]
MFLYQENLTAWKRSLSRNEPIPYNFKFGSLCIKQLIIPRQVLNALPY